MIAQMTVRRVSDRLEAELRRRAELRGCSLNRAILDLLEEATGLQSARGKRRDLTRLAGTWSAEEFADFERHTEPFAYIDEDVWQQ
jgi:hypothetical protein